MSSSLDAAELFGVKGLVAVITGGGTGIGFMMAKALEANGAKVYIVGRRIEILQKAAEQAKHGNIIPLQGDVTSKSDLLRIVDTITKSDGFINLLIANSGITGPQLLEMPKNPSLTQFRDFLMSQNSEEINSVFHVNTTAVLFTIVSFLELLDAGNKKGNVQQTSQVVATTSVVSFSRVSLVSLGYSASKAATNHLIKQMATALVPYGIRSNSIAPGLYPSELAGDLMDKMIASGGFAKNSIPAERQGKIEDMAGAVLYVASKAGGYLNGSVILTDGGRLCVVPSTY